MNKFLIKFAALLLAGLIVVYFMFAEGIHAWHEFRNNKARNVV